MAQKKYVSLSKLSTFLDNIKTTFSQIGHKHTISDITDYTVDSELSSTSANPVQNKVIDAEFDAIATAMGTLETAIDNKAASEHTHDDRYYTESEIDQKITEINTSLDAKSDVSHNHNDTYYTEAEIDEKVSTINASITNIENGTTVVAKANHSVNADIATSAASATKAYQDGDGNVIKDIYETKADSASKLSEAKSYADGIKNDLLNGAGGAYDTLKELGDLIDDNKDAIDALETIAANKADKVIIREW